MTSAGATVSSSVPKTLIENQVCYAQEKTGWFVSPAKAIRVGTTPEDGRVDGESEHCTVNAAALRSGAREESATRGGQAL